MNHEMEQRQRKQRAHDIVAMSEMAGFGLLLQELRESVTEQWMALLRNEEAGQAQLNDARCLHRAISAIEATVWNYKRYVESDDIDTPLTEVEHD